MATTANSTTDASKIEYLQDVLNALFGAVGLVSLILAFFAIWLSWQFYKESRQQNDRVSEAVNRIESTVAAVKAHMEQIVEKTVDNLLSSQPGYSEGPVQETFAGLGDLQKKIAELEGKQVGGDEPLISELKAMVLAQEEKIEEFVRSSRETHVRSFFGSATPKAVSSEVTIIQRSDGLEKGSITLRISRPVKIATGTGKFGTLFKVPPILQVELIGFPGNSVTPVLNSGVGSGTTLNEFNVHLNAPPGKEITPGVYVISYEANVSNSIDSV